MATTAYEFRSNLRDEFTEHLSDMRDDQYWQDTISELADSAVPIYTTDIVALWLDMGCPEVDDAGMIEGVTDVSKIIAIAIYEEASQYLYELANHAGLE